MKNIDNARRYLSISIKRPNIKIHKTHKLYQVPTKTLTLFLNLIDVDLTPIISSSRIS